MRRPKPDRFVRWKKVETPTCDLVANSVLPHTKGEVAIASYRSAQDGVFNVCENCDAYIRAAKWLAERGKDPSETAVAAAAQVIKTGEYAFVPSQGSAHMTRNVCEHMYAYLKNGKYFYTGSRFFVKLHGVPDADIKEVNVTENPAGDYYGWKDKNGEIKFIWPSEAQRDMCFPYGPKVEEDKGTGVRVRLSVTQKEPQ